MKAHKILAFACGCLVIGAIGVTACILKGGHDE